MRQYFSKNNKNNSKFVYNVYQAGEQERRCTEYACAQDGFFLCGYHMVASRGIVYCCVGYLCMALFCCVHCAVLYVCASVYVHQYP